MKLKKFILFTVVLSFLFMGIGIYFNIPATFISQDATSFEYIVTNVLIASTKAIIILSVIVHIRNNIKLERFYKKKQKASS